MPTGGAKEVFVTNDPDEGELFIAARRAAFPAIEARGSILLEDVGAPVPQLPQLLSGIAELAEKYAVEIPVVAHAGDGNTHPIIVFDRGDTEASDRAYLAFSEIMQPRHRARRHDHRGARCRPRQEGSPARSARTGCDGSLTDDQRRPSTRWTSSIQAPSSRNAASRLVMITGA